MQTEAKVLLPSVSLVLLLENTILYDTTASRNEKINPPSRSLVILEF